jgi:hypothetical protein
MTFANMIDEVSSDDDAPVSDEDTQRFVSEILEAAGPQGLTADQIDRAFGAPRFGDEIGIVMGCLRAEALDRRIDS